jgi:hypothetical protein
MKKTSLLIILISSLALGMSGCTGQQVKKKTSLEIQAIQSQEFETSKSIGFASVLSVFQDLGYIVESADKETGFITAKSPTQSKHDWLFTGSRFQSNTKATAFVEEIIKGKTKVRLNFVNTEKSSSAWGQNSQQDVPVEDATVYKKAFKKIGDAIFIRSSS